MRIMHAVPDDNGGSLEDALLIGVRSRIRRLREEKGLTQAQAGRRVGINQWGWSRIETGDVELRLVTLLQVQHALGVETLENLLDDLPSASLAAHYAVHGELGPRKPARSARRQERSRTDKGTPSP